MHPVHHLTHLHNPTQILFVLVREVITHRLYARTINFVKSIHCLHLLGIGMVHRRPIFSKRPFIHRSDSMRYHDIQELDSGKQPAHEASRPSIKLQCTPIIPDFIMLPSRSFSIPL